MNYFKLAMRVFKKHNIDFVRVAVKREKLKQMVLSKRKNGEPISQEEIKKLNKEMKEDIARINKIIGEFLK